MNHRHAVRGWPFALLCVVLFAPAVAGAVELGEAQWIWAPQYPIGQAPDGDVFFRRTFELGAARSAQLEITCDNAYELIVNRHRVGAGDDWSRMDTFNVQPMLVAGKNAIAIRAHNQGAGHAGLVLRLVVKQADQKTVTMVSNAAWKTSDTADLLTWAKIDFDDRKWPAAKALGKFGSTAPWGKPQVAAPADRFTPLDGFKVEEVVSPGQTGSLVNMAFSERGDIIASREGGPLLLIQDKDRDGQFETIGTFTDKVRNCHGILPLAGRVLAVGDGPAGTALYRLDDTTGDGLPDEVKPLVKFKGGMGEHGPHAAVLGPDALVYVMLGNHTHEDAKLADSSPHHDHYDAELLEPKFEDANGHAAGIKAPGGTILRTDQEGSFVELYCGGFRNAFDIGVSRAGELFTYDSDMEWDVGLPWYRPTRVNHTVPGAEFGWRSGWSKWPTYYIDSLPETIDIGRGSPTGLEFYNHTRFPAKYHDALFMCDWSVGRVLAVFLRPAGGSFSAESEVFLEGRPLNCSDIAVGPDGWLYICVGGRGTQGSIFRVVTVDPPAAADEKPADPLRRALGQPQLYSAWGRKALGEIKAEMGAAWATQLAGVAAAADAPATDRQRALDLLQVLGPPAPLDLLLQLSADADVQVRAKAAYQLGLHKEPAATERLIALAGDPQPAVRRLSYDALARLQAQPPLDKVLSGVGDPDRWISWAACRALERLPREAWRASVLETDQIRLFLGGSTALLTMNPDREVCQAVLTAAGGWLARTTLDADQRVYLLRIVALALDRGALAADDVPQLRAQLSALYPAADPRLSRELVRTLVYLDEPSLAPRLVAQLAADLPLEEKLHIIMHASFLRTGWTPELRQAVLVAAENARLLPGGNSYAGYITNAVGKLLTGAPAAEQVQAIAAGARTPGVILGLVRQIADKPLPGQLDALRQLDSELAGNKSQPARDLAKAALAALARGDGASGQYVRGLFEAAPERRAEIGQAIALASPNKPPAEEDWPLLVRSLAVVEGSAAADVLRALARSPRKDVKPADLRQVILLGLKLQNAGGREAAHLLAHWTGHKPAEDAAVPPTAMVAWQNWFVQNYPDLPEPTLPVEAAGNKWTFAQLLDFLASEKTSAASAERGAAVFEKGQCSKCHRFGNRGEGIGPDLTSVSSRFQRKEILESVIFPSQVISDQFAAKTVVTLDGQQFTGLVGPAGDDVVVLQSNGEKVTVAKSNIDEIVPSKKSAMPEGLFNALSLEEIADLFAYLGKLPAAR